MELNFNKIDDVNATITINLVKADYSDAVQTSLKTLRKKASVPGFRPGMAPASMIEKMYGKSVLFEEVNKLTVDKLTDYIRTENLHVLGEPLPSEGQPTIDFDTAVDFSFTFDVALAPEINISLSKADTLPYYKIAVSDEMIDRQIASYRANFGEYGQHEEVAEKDLVKGVLTELDENGEPKVDGIVVEKAILMPSFIKNEEEKNKFIGAKLESSVVFNPYKAYEGITAELTSLLKIQKDEVEAHTGDFALTIDEISSYQEAEIDQKLFDKVFGEGTVKSEQEFREKIAEIIGIQLTPQSDYKFMIDLRDLLHSKAGKPVFPDAFLKRWLKFNNKDRTDEKIEEDYPKIIEDLTYHLVNEKILKDNNIEVDDNAVREAAKSATRAQFAQYGMTTVPNDMLEKYADDMLKKEDTVRNLVNKVLEDKLAAAVKETVTIDEKTVSVEEFEKFFKTDEEATENK